MLIFCFLVLILTKIVIYNKITNSMAHRETVRAGIRDNMSALRSQVSETSTSSEAIDGEARWPEQQTRNVPERTKRPVGSAFLRKLCGKSRKSYLSKAEKRRMEEAKELSEIRKQNMTLRMQAKIDAMSVEERNAHEARIAREDADAFKRVSDSRVITSQQQVEAPFGVLYNTAADIDHWRRIPA